MVKDNFGSVFLVLLVAFVINAVGAVICGIGLLVTAPICWIIVAYTYRKLNNQPDRARNASSRWHRPTPSCVFCAVAGGSVPAAMVFDERRRRRVPRPADRSSKVTCSSSRARTS